MTTPFLCLNMIVKNESRIITRLFDSCLPIIDSYCICDTGSTDNTIEIIRKYFAERKVPGEVFQIPFQDFGFNRTKSLERAEKWGQYALLLDADMILEISPQFNKSDLVLDGYQVKQKNAVLEYDNIRIVRTDKGIKCVGVTHEYYDFPAGTNTERLTTLEINDIGDGGAKSDKYERDIRLLRKGLHDNPKNDRYHFYLANSYRDLATMIEHQDQKQAQIYLKKSIKWYKRRLAMGGWDEELFMCCLELGNIYRKLGKPEHSIHWWIEGYLYRPSRAETLYELIKFYREKDPKCVPIAKLFYDVAKTIPYPVHDGLFIHKNVYDTLLDYEGFVLDSYLGSNIDQYKYLELLGKHDDLSQFKFNVKRLSSLRPVRKVFNQPVTLGSSQFYPSTPCLIPYHDGYLMNQRYVNYLIESNGCFTFTPPITSFNRRTVFDHQLNVIQQFDFDQVQPNLPVDSNSYLGIENVKIFPYIGQIMFLGTEQSMTTKKFGVSGGIYPTSLLERGCSEKNGLLERGRSEKNSDHETSHALSSTIYQSPTGSDGEKNWCYLEHQGQLKVLYKWYPITVGQIIDGQLKNTLTLTHTDDHVPQFFRHLNISSSGFSYEDEIWFVAHMVKYGTPCQYYHCVLILDGKTLKYKRHSILFKFEEAPIEYCLGMIVEPDRLMFGYSKMDRESVLGAYSRPEIDRFLFPTK